MKIFLMALQFLTVFPVKLKSMDERKFAFSLVYFPLIGLFLGLILVISNKFFLFLNFEQLYINIMLVVLLIALTGGLHLDGLADTADALLSNRSREEKLRIMRDPHIGVMGILAVISIVLLKISFLSSVTSLNSALFLMCLLSRWGMVFLIFVFPYARTEGKAKSFFEGINYKIFLLTTLIVLGCAFFIWGFKGLVVWTIAAMSVWLIGKFINKQINGITGDTIGAVSEIIEVIVLFAICILSRIVH